MLQRDRIDLRCEINNISQNSFCLPYELTFRYENMRCNVA